METFGRGEWLGQETGHNGGSGQRDQALLKLHRQECVHHLTRGRQPKEKVAERTGLPQTPAIKGYNATGGATGANHTTVAMYGVSPGRQ